MSSIGVGNLIQEYANQTSLGVFTTLGAVPGGNQTFASAISRGMVSPFFCTALSTQKNKWFEGTASLSGNTLTFQTIGTNSSGSNTALDLSGSNILIYNQVPAENLVFVEPSGAININPAIGYRSVSSGTTVTISDAVIDVNASGGDVTIIYPVNLGNGSATRNVKISKIDAGVNVVNISDGTNIVAQLIAPANGAICQSCYVYSNGTSLIVTGLT